MFRIIAPALETLAAAVFLIPLFYHYARNHNRPFPALFLLFALYLAGVYAAVGLPDILRIRYEPRFNFEPFLYMFSDWESSMLNVVLFLPLGFFLPLLWQEYRSLGNVLLAGFTLSLFIECLQIFTVRATDINDLITNTLGALLGYLLFRIFGIPAPQPNHSISGLYRLCTGVFIIMFGPHAIFLRLVKFLFRP